MNNFNEMPFGNELLLAMYNTPSKTLSTEQIAEIISNKLSTEEKTVVVDKGMVSAIYSKLGESLGKDLDLRKRLRVTPKANINTTVRVTKVNVLNGIYGQLGLVPVVNGEEPPVDEEEFTDGTKQDQQLIDETVETNQFARNTESIYYSNGVA